MSNNSRQTAVSLLLTGILLLNGCLGWSLHALFPCHCDHHLGTPVAVSKDESSERAHSCCANPQDQPGDVGSSHVSSSHVSSSHVSSSHVSSSHVSSSHVGSSNCCLAEDGPTKKELTTPSHGFPDQANGGDDIGCVLCHYLKQVAVDVESGIRDLCAPTNSSLRFNGPHRFLESVSQPSTRGPPVVSVPLC